MFLRLKGLEVPRSINRGISLSGLFVLHSQILNIRERIHPKS